MVIRFAIRLIGCVALIAAVAPAKTIEVRASPAPLRWSTGALKAKAAVAADTRRLLQIFRLLHDSVHDERVEARIASAVAGELAVLGFDVRSGADGSTLVAILRNGPGPVVVYRTDTGVNVGAVASERSQQDSAEQSSSSRTEPPIARCFGREANVVWMLGVAKAVVELRADWAGTLVLMSHAGRRLGYAEPSVTGERKASDVLPVPDMVITFGASPAPLGAMLAVRAKRHLGSNAMDLAMSRRGVYEMPRYLDSAARLAAATMQRSRWPEGVAFGYVLVGIGDRESSSEAPEIIDPEPSDESLAVPVDPAAVALGAQVATTALVELLRKPSPSGSRAEAREWTPHPY